VFKATTVKHYSSHSEQCSSTSKGH